MLSTLFIKYVRAAVGGDDIEKNSAVLGHWKITFKFLTPSVRGTMHSPTRLYRELREKHHTGTKSIGMSFAEIGKDWHKIFRMLRRGEMPGCLRDFKPIQHDLARTMQQKKFLKIPALKQKRRNDFLFHCVLIAASSIIAFVNVGVGKYEGASVTLGLERTAILADVSEIAAAGVSRDEDASAPGIIQIAVDLLNICVFRVAFADDQYRLLRFHGDQIYGNGTPE